MSMLSVFNTRSVSSDVLTALEKSFATIEFKVDGTIVRANKNFLDAVGYNLSDIVGKHHSMFVEDSYRRSEDYKQFWATLQKGIFQKTQFKRIRKDGSEIWIEASYNPVLDKNGKVYSVVKMAVDITAQKLELANLTGQMNAISKAQAVIEFDLEGNILQANENFLTVLGYRLEEIKGKHHRMFVTPDYAKSAEYVNFWADLRAGKFNSGQYERIGKGGKSVWIEASYNPIFDMNGKPFKVVKYATDITKNVELLKNLNNIINKNFTEVDVSLDRSNSQSDAATNAANVTSTTIQTVAASTEELVASIDEIARRMDESRSAAERASEQSATAGDATTRLSKAANAMSGIVSLIQNIAGQINLLALNATIESARAGEAGRGFAVVANEVKNLANQAANATSQISQEIGSVQSISNDVVVSLDAIASALVVMQSTVTASASAIEEQSVVTRDISQNMQTASASVATIYSSLTDLNSSVGAAKSLFAETKQAAAVLAR